jgi:hypothetical protein
MGFKKPIELDSVLMHLSRAYGEVASTYNDGFTAFYVKQDLYRVKFILDEMLKELPEFSGEKEWLEEESKKKMWKELKR